MFKTLPPLQLLIAFEAAARLGSFKRTATELHLSASAISQQMRALEEELGVRLFQRQRREMTLTEAGARYAQAVRDALKTLDRETQHLRDRSQRRLIRLSAEAYLVYEHLIPNIEAFQQSVPDVDLRLETSTALADLASEPVDAAVRCMAHPPSDPSLSFALLQRQSLSLVCAPSLASQIRTRQDLAVAPVVCLEGRFDEVWGLLAQHMGIVFRPRSTFLVDSYYGMIGAAERGQGVAFALRPATERPLRDGRLVELPGTTMAVSLAFYMVCRQADEQRPEMLALRSWVGELFDDAAGTRRASRALA